MRAILSFAAYGLLMISASTASAQSSSSQFEREALARLERIEQILLTGGHGPGRIIASTDLLCGVNSDCVDVARNFCVRVGFQRGVPLKVDVRTNVVYLTQVTCLG